ncbi:CDC9 (YDL164C) [Zygosaccharomyces parabailii]|nr:CDC9 (YDL164C) [Zygosaccharomyces parabailii]
MFRCINIYAQMSRYSFQIVIYKCQKKEKIKIADVHLSLYRDNFNVFFYGNLALITLLFLWCHPILLCDHIARLKSVLQVVVVIICQTYREHCMLARLVHCNTALVGAKQLRMASSSQPKKQTKQATLARFFSSVKEDSSSAKKSPEKSPKKDDSPNTPIRDFNPGKEERSPIFDESIVKSSAGSEIEAPAAKRLKIEVKETPKLSNYKYSQVPYSKVCSIFQEIESTSSRLSIIKICSDFFTEIVGEDPQNLIPTTYLFINKLGPDYEPGMELGLGEGLLMKTISESCGKSLAQVKNRYKEMGDLGQIAMEARNVQPTMFKPKPLTVGEVFVNLRAIANAQGKDSQTKKIKLIKRMLTACQGVEAKFLIRSLESKLRIGLAEKTVLISLSKALLKHERGEGEPSDEAVTMAEERIRDAFCQVPNYEIVINVCLQYGISQLQNHCKLRPGIPLKPMLAKPTKAITEVLDRFHGQVFVSEYKYDGERAQVHLLPDGTMRIYSRNGENMTERYPEIDIRDFLVDTSSTHSLIIDCEAVAWDKVNNKILPFQVLSTRKRKDVEAKDIKVRVCLFAFDLLCHNGEPLINQTLRERQDTLQRVTKPVDGEFRYATRLITSNTEELQHFLDQSVKDCCEGLMVKMVDGQESHYEPSKRSRNWLKLKKDYLNGVGDSLDLCVLGAYYGRGKRTGTYGGFLLGCYNQDTGEYETCCKIGTGFSEELLQQLYEKLKPTATDGPMAFYVFDSSAQPDVWFEPTLLFEVLAADLSLSPIYKAGCSHYDKGISLRFPRFLRIREDKPVEEATSSEQVVDLYEAQAHLS